jgi:hypothetical protein
MVTKKQTCQFVASFRIDGCTPALYKKKDEAICVSIEEWTAFTNMRAILTSAGAGGFEPFTPNKIRNFIALYILQGLSSSPKVKLKFQGQFEDHVNGSDMVESVFGKNAEKRHKMFKTYFSVHDPGKIDSPKTSHPNFKIDPFQKGCRKLPCLLRT